MNNVHRARIELGQEARVQAIASGGNGLAPNPGGSSFEGELRRIGCGGDRAASVNRDAGCSGGRGAGMEGRRDTLAGDVRWG